MPYYPPEVNTIDRIWLCLVGSPGTGKTNLIRTIPNVLLMDFDGGAAKTGLPRFTFPHDAAGYNEMKQLIQAISRLRPDSDGLLTHQEYGFQFDTVALDSLNMAQKLCSLTIPKHNNKLRWYGALLDAMVDDIITPLMQSNVNVIITIHDKMLDVDTDKYGQVIEREVSGQETLPEMGLGLDGSLRNRIVAWFTAMFHTVRDQQGVYHILTQPKAVGNRYYVAKDRYHLANGKSVTWKFDKKGMPDTDILRKVLEESIGGIRESFKNREVLEAKGRIMVAATEVEMFSEGTVKGNAWLQELIGDDKVTYENHEELVPQIIERVKAWRKPLGEKVIKERIKAVKDTWVLTAREVGMLDEDPKKALSSAEVTILKQVLGDLNDNIDPYEWKAAIEQGNTLIRAWNPDTQESGDA